MLLLIGISRNFSKVIFFLKVKIPYTYKLSKYNLFMKSLQYVSRSNKSRHLDNPWLQRVKLTKSLTDSFFMTHARQKFRKFH